MTRSPIDHIPHMVNVLVPLELLNNEDDRDSLVREIRTTGCIGCGGLDSIVQSDYGDEHRHFDVEHRIWNTDYKKSRKSKGGKKSVR